MLDGLGQIERCKYTQRMGHRHQINTSAKFFERKNTKKQKDKMIVIICTRSAKSEESSIILKIGKLMVYFLSCLSCSSD
jgi:hypothetical protein